MQTTHSLGFALSCSIATLTMLGTAGCQRRADADRVAVVPVSGAVAYDGRPTPGALVVFHPAGGVQSLAPPAAGTVRDDGTFELTTYTAHDGAPPGEYKVTVEWRQLVHNNGDVVCGPNVLPSRYSRPQTTNLSVRVAEGTNRLPTLHIRR